MNNEAQILMNTESFIGSKFFFFKIQLLAPTSHIYAVLSMDILCDKIFSYASFLKDSKHILSQLFFFPSRWS